MTQEWAQRVQSNGHAGSNGHADLALPGKDRLPPRNLEAERSLLAACLWDNDVIDDAAAALEPSDFYRAAHEEAFAALVELREAGGSVDAVSLGDLLERKGRLHALGGNRFLEELASPPGTVLASHATRYVAIIKAKSQARRLIEASLETIEECYSHLHTAQELVARAEERIFKVAERSVSMSLVGMGELMDDRVVAFDRRRAGEAVGLPTGWRGVDEILGGLAPGSLTYVGARTSLGKTSWLMGLASNAALAGARVLFVSLEMGREAVGDRLIAMHGPVDGRLLQQARFLDEVGVAAVYHGIGRAGVLPIHLDDAPGRTVAHVLAQARRLKRRIGLELICVDYLQLLDAQQGKGENRQEAVSRLSWRLKAMARELAVPVACAVQLNRAPESAKDHEPKLWHLRESGSLENDADVVILLHRPEYYDPNNRPGEADCIVAKNRNGPIGTAGLAFSTKHQRFDDLALVRGPVDVGEPF